jgi:uncharacterized protein (DUF1919 family)
MLFYGKIISILRKKINMKNSKRLKNKDFSLLASNCNGAFILHDLNLKFNSPTVNLFMYPSDFVKYIKNLEYYSKCDLKFIKKDDTAYPVGKLDDIEIHFMHYKDENEAERKWRERTDRIDFDNMFIMMTDRDGCSLEDLKEFDKLPYKNKVVFTHKEYPEIKSSVYIKGFENEKNVGNLYSYKNRFTGYKYYDDFDYVEWFNSRTAEKQ